MSLAAALQVRSGALLVLVVNEVYLPELLTTDNFV